MSGGTRMESIAEMMDNSKSAWTGLRILWARATSRSLARQKRLSNEYVCLSLLGVLTKKLTLEHVF